MEDVERRDAHRERTRPGSAPHRGYRAPDVGARHGRTSRHSCARRSSSSLSPSRQSDVPVRARRRLRRCGPAAAPSRDHDVDFVVAEEDAELAADLLARARASRSSSRRRTRHARARRRCWRFGVIPVTMADRHPSDQEPPMSTGTEERRRQRHRARPQAGDGPRLLLLFIVGDILGAGVYAVTGEMAARGRRHRVGAVPGRVRGGHADRVLLPRAGHEVPAGRGRGALHAQGVRRSTS